MDLVVSKFRTVSAGLDWVTLTSTSEHTQSRMRSYFAGVALRDSRLGYQTKKGGAFGFYGEKTRHALLACKDDRSMLQVSGQEAQGCYRLARKGDHATRLDIQVTIRVPEGQVNKTLERICAEARGAKYVRGKRPTVKSIEGEHGTETVLIGRRASEIFIRCYDKYEESGKEEWKNCVRLEVELKGKTSQALWSIIASENAGPGYYLGVLRTILERRGLSLDWVEWPGKSKAIPIKEKTSQQRTRAWWASQVAPSVARDVAEWGFYTAMSILFEKCLTEGDRTRIMNAWSISWGN
jgi:hypothetical protein